MLCVSMHSKQYKRSQILLKDENIMSDGNRNAFRIYHSNHTQRLRDKLVQEMQLLLP